MLMGEFHHSLDAKGRIIIPTKFREQLGNSLVLTRGMDGCLFGYSLTEWNLLEAKLQKLPLTKRNARSFVRFFYSAAAEYEFDKQGRVNLSNVLVNYAQLTKECVIAGVGERIEIWDAGKWEDLNQAISTNFDQLSEDLQDLLNINL